METTRKFKVDTRRHRSRAKFQSKIRHVLAIMTFMFPLAALFMWAMAMLRFDTLGERRDLYHAALGCIAAGVVSSMFWGIMVALKNQRHATTRREREERQRERAEELRLEREKMAERRSAAAAGGNAAPDAGGPAAP